MRYEAGKPNSATFHTFLERIMRTSIYRLFGTIIGSERLQQQQQGSNRPPPTSASTLHPVRAREELVAATQQLMAGTYNPRQPAHNWPWRGNQHHGHHVFQ